MTRLRNLAAGLAVAASVVAVGPAMAGVGGVANGGFEDPLNALTNWTKTSGANADASQHYAGNKSGKLGSTDSLSQLVTQLLEQTTYTLSFYVKTNNTSSNGSLLVSLAGGMAGAFPFSTTTSYSLGSLSTSWTLKTITFTTGASLSGYVSTLLSFTTGALGGGTKVYLDQVSIAEVKGNPVPGPIAGAGLPVLLAGGAWLYRRRKAVA